VLGRRFQKKIYKLTHPPIGEVLMLHRVLPQRSLLTANRQLEITPEFLNRTIAGYVDKGYELISLNELEEILKNKKKLKHPFVCFTLDDGYKDNFEIAYPIFRRHNCPFAIYLTTDFPDRKAFLWWYILEDILKQNNELLLGDGTLLKAETLFEKDKVFNYIREKVFSANYDDVELLMKGILVNYSYSFSDKTEHLALNWSQIIDLAQDSLCTIGSHSITHRVLTGLSTKQLSEELIRSRIIIEQYIKLSVKHFAYPYGIYDARVKDFVRQAGYTTSVIVNGGKVRNEKRSEFEIKRILIEE